LYGNRERKPQSAIKPTAAAVAARLARVLVVTAMCGFHILIVFNINAFPFAGFFLRKTCTLLLLVSLTTAYT